MNPSQTKNHIESLPKLPEVCFHLRIDDIRFPPSESLQNILGRIMIHNRLHHFIESCQTVQNGFCFVISPLLDGWMDKEWQGQGRYMVLVVFLSFARYTPSQSTLRRSSRHTCTRSSPVSSSFPATCRRIRWFHQFGCRRVSSNVFKWCSRVLRPTDER